MELNPTPITPQKERPFIPRLKDGGFLGGHGDFEHGEPQPPRYSQSMDATWQVVQHIRDTWLVSKRRQFLYHMQRIANVANNPDVYIAWPDFVFSLSPELICEASLHVVGILTDDGEIVEVN